MGETASTAAIKHVLESKASTSNPVSIYIYPSRGDWVSTDLALIWGSDLPALMLPSIHKLLRFCNSSSTWYGKHSLRYILTMGTVYNYRRY